MEPITKVRFKERISFLCLLIVFHGAFASMPRCEKSPLDQAAGKIGGDNGFSISVSGSPRKYRPNQVYTLNLSGTRDELIAKFQGFVVVAEQAMGNNAIQSPTSLGTFQLMKGDAMTKFSHRCSHAVEATSSMNKEEITVYWTSPQRGSGCIDFKAMVVERQDVWYMDDGALTYSMCEDDSPLAEPTVVQPCCACDEAKYEVIFEGIWSRHTHAKDFPRDEWRTMFSTLIGASHSGNYTLWEYGRPASPALQVLGEVGVTRRLESEMKRFSQSIRSVVKAHGLQQRSNVVGQTFAVFRVDRTHHLLSVVSKMIPSPDWIVGLSKENLCLPNCSWVDNRVIDLYPWDIGTDSGLRYDGPPTPQRPKGMVQRITSSAPHSAESPFYDPTGAPMKPAARLHLIKQREYFKNCPEGMARPGSSQGGPLNPSWNNPLTGQDFGGGYGGGAPGTSYFYGVGIGANQQIQPEDTYDEPSYSNQDPVVNNNYDYTNPDVPLQPESEYGGGYGGGYGDPYSGNNGYISDPCGVTGWGDWSECSATCDSGSHNRLRDYLDRALAQSNDCNAELFEKKPCAYLPRCETKSYVGSFTPFEVEQQLSGISTQWVDRGLESAPRLQGGRSSYTYDGSGAGNSYRGGYAQGGNINKNAQSGYNNDAQSGGYGNSYTYDGSSVVDPQNEQPPRSARLNSLMQDSAPNCDVSNWGDWSDCSSKCDSGSRTRTRRYEYLEQSSSCTLDLYEVQPCRGNEADCPPPRGPNGTPAYDLPPTTGMGFGYGQQPQNTFQQDDPACQTSDWSAWSPCSKKCGSGFQRRTRLYLIPFVPNRSCDVRLYDKTDCYGTDTSCDNYGYYGDAVTGTEDNYEKSTNVVIQSLVEQQQNNVNTVQDYDDNTAPGATEICSADKDPGTCHGHAERWYFDSQTGTCKTFSYTGCYGNRNNFASKHKCESTCLSSNPNNMNNNNQNMYGGRGSFRSRSWPGQNNAAVVPNRVDNWRQLEALSFIKVTTEPPQVNTLRPALDCQVSAWSTWTSCSQSCGTGWQTRQREVLVIPGPGGKACPKKMARRKKCRPMPCPADTKYWYQGSWRHMADPDDV